MSEESVFVAADQRFVATDLARGPWDPNAQHGGAPAALLMRAFEQVDGDAGLALARVTYEFVRPVPFGPLSVEVHVLRPGRRVQLLEGTLRDSAGVEVVRARALRVRRAQAVESGPETCAFPGPSQGWEDPPRNPHQAGRTFGANAMEIRFVEGSFSEPGPATAWFRLRCALVFGEAPSPLQRLAAAGDFGNGISSTLSWHEHVFINPDLTLYVEREPAGEWICLQSSTRITSSGVGISESVMYDERGRVGRAIQALLVAPR